MTLGTAVDVAIVGAGAAGLAAARTAVGAGLSVLVLEAKDRIGGRAWTREILPGVPVDMGARWLHSANENPLAEFGRNAGFTLGPRNLEREVFLTDLGRWADADELRERLIYFHACEEAIAAAARSGRDVPIVEVLPRHPRWRPMFEHWVTLYSAVDARSASTADYANYRDTHENWPVREGYGALIARYGAGLPVSLGTAVRSIAWARRPARLVTAKGTVQARHVIVTVSTGVLGAEAIRFDPPLPPDKLAAIEALPLGRANWVAIAFDRNVFGEERERAVSIWAPTPRTCGFSLRPGGADLCLGFYGAGLSSELELAGREEMVAFALERLRAAFGASIAQHVAATLTSAWQSDPNVRGGYSAARPGSAHLRAVLAQPVDDILHFAGEATSPEFFTTVHGALRSGIRAAEEAASALGKGAPVPH